MLKLKEVQEKTGISYHTVVKYTGLGLIPKAERIWRGRKGSESVYPDNVIQTIKGVKEEQRAGLSLRQISEKVRRGVDVFAELMTMYPDYRFSEGEIMKVDKQPGKPITVIVKLVGEKRR